MRQLLEDGRERRMPLFGHGATSGRNVTGSPPTMMDIAIYVYYYFLYIVFQFRSLTGVGPLPEPRSRPRVPSCRMPLLSGCRRIGDNRGCGRLGDVLRVGLTGGIGAGKSAVARMLAGHGAVVIDADAIAREVVAVGTPGLLAVVAEFGPHLLRADGSLDREALGAVVFADSAARRRLEAITHPLVGAEAVRRMAAAPSDAVVVYDVPLLVEAGLSGGYDVIVVVEAPPGVRLARLEARGLGREQALARMANQASDSARRAVADILLDNSGSLEDLRARVDEVWTSLRGRCP
ncbi:dephospho-CoA kinase [Frankia sp. Cj3]|uniref:dephospho-CoA kinase n=1 Tax=Frankia sp. Cj3 TaxID=2880976 RepID=UPI0035B485ED